MRTKSVSLWAVCLGSLLGCAPIDGAGTDGTDTSSGELFRVVGGHNALGLDRVRNSNMIHGIAVDDRMVFVTEVLNGRVIAFDRITGRKLGEVAPPPGGFLLPFTLRIAPRNRLVVLDTGGFPSPGGLAIPRVYDYTYRWNDRTRTLETTLARTVRFEGLPVGFSEDLEVLDDGSYVLSDSVLGSLWLIDRDGTIRPGLVPTSLNFGEGLPFMQPCISGSTVVDGLPFDLGGGYAPGIGSLAASQGYLYWGSLCWGGVHRISISTLRDATRSAEVRAAEIQVVSEQPAAAAMEVLKGLTFNRDDYSDAHLYATDCFNMQVVRIDVITGAREVVLKNSTLLNFPVAAAFAPATFGISSLWVSSDQEHRFTAINTAIAQDQFRPPFIASEILFNH